MSLLQFFVMVPSNIFIHATANHRRGLYLENVNIVSNGNGVERQHPAMETLDLKRFSPDTAWSSAWGADCAEE